LSIYRKPDSLLLEALVVIQCDFLSFLNVPDGCDEHGFILIVK